MSSHKVGLLNFHGVLCVVLVIILKANLCSGQQSACEKKILKSYPEAVCSSEKNKETCRTSCEEKGEKKCQVMNLNMLSP